MPQNGIVNDLEKILGALANLSASDGDTKAVAILALGKVTIKQTEYDRWHGGVTGFTIYIEVPQTLYHQLDGELNSIEEVFTNKSNGIVRHYEGECIDGFVITTELLDDPQWREKARAFVSGQGVTNQGRVRSDNLAPRTCEGLLFRSEPEIHLFRALRSTGIAVSPLPVFLHGGTTYRRIEPDFILIKDGIVMSVEVDGDTVHRESPQEAHDRMTMLTHEGVHLERVNANECNTSDKAVKCAAKLLSIIEKLRTNR